ncbi:DUF551 domain-containing protein [Escherichia coli]|nr:DUF551 domain-containing protein [Escherichia coli]HAH0497600.1 DUF551 domain-containing protein [Escherichia coli]
MSTIPKERLEQLASGNAWYCVQDDEAAELARIALASLEAEPYGYVHKAAYEKTGSCGLSNDREAYRYSSTHVAVYTATPAPVSVPAAMEIDDDFDSAFEHGKAVGWNAYRAAMLQAEPASNHEELPLDYLQGQKDGLEWAAQLAEANHPQTGDWLYDDPLELAKAIRKGPDMPEFDGPTPVTPDGWISCSERMPNTKTAVLVAVEFDRKGDWRMKWATYIPEHPDANDGWIIPGASWKPSHWMPLPEPPQGVNDAAS